MSNFIDWEKSQKTILFDSSMGLGLKSLGFDVNNPLWTAKALVTDPDKIYQVHREYFDAGSNIASTDSYQANLAGFIDQGYTRDEAEKWIKGSVQLAQKAREDSTGKQTKWVAGAIGPYGAYLADGSEYTGDYSLSDEDLRAFHQDRLDWLIAAGVDLLAIKTIPNFKEIQVLAQMISKYPDVPVYFSLSLKDAHHLSDGTDLHIVQDFLEKQPSIVAYGANCFHPRFADDAIKYFTENAKGDKDILIAPNAGGQYDPSVKKWGEPIDKVFSDNAPKWREEGAKWIGGCCEMKPEEMQAVHDELVQ
ncbi:homocysteine S-methyltransferase [Eupransor demetentiae]|uniref:Homocysteine/selenocysteine methylase (S-methylmethionine-dependent) (MHT1) n=1 Tax=Eupransor demetentiae TaxID=3109584 RepID=A0ABM9N2X0_9LACO|nr:Homocysteine/selenocysteine methylase (S-methylmethionine-dependent) (MHT1) [Lactobacillaceae bacterium LMG 33000]